jgi:hypothetical protein
VNGYLPSSTDAEKKKGQKKNGLKKGLQRSDRVHAKQAQIKFKCQA